MVRQDFSRRSQQAELMDDPTVDYAAFSDCLRGLSMVNRLTLAKRPTLHFIDKVSRLKRQGILKQGGGPLKILDIGSGCGDMLVAIERWAVKNHCDVALYGIDLNPHATKTAQASAPKRSKINFITANAFDFVADHDVDIVISSLFTHHLRDEEIATFIAWMDKTAKIGWFINDLYRHPVPYYAFLGISRLGHFNKFVQHDGPVSIARSFRRGDWERYLAASGIDMRYLSITGWFPFRLCLEMLKT